MNPMIQKFVTQEFLTESEAMHIENAISNKESIIVSGHRSAGIRPFMATLMAVAKGKFSSIQVKSFDDLNKDAEYFLIPGLDNIDFEKLVQDAMTKPNTSFITLKEPEHPYSILKLLKDVYKLNGDYSKVYNMIECRKVDDVPKLITITKMQLDEKGKVIKADLK